MGNLVEREYWADAEEELVLAYLEEDQFEDILRKDPCTCILATLSSCVNFSSAPYSDDPKQSS